MFGKIKNRIARLRVARSPLRGQRQRHMMPARRLAIEQLEQRTLLSAIPNDPQFAQYDPGDVHRWHHDKMETPAAWESFQERQYDPTPGVPGDEVAMPGWGGSYLVEPQSPEDEPSLRAIVIAVVDTGVDYTAKEPCRSMANAA